LCRRQPRRTGRAASLAERSRPRGIQQGKGGPVAVVAGSVRGASRPACPASYQPSTYAKTSGATIVASDSMMKRGVSGPSLPHVIFSFGTAPEYDP
jgi:hypothetical protein